MVREIVTKLDREWEIAKAQIIKDLEDGWSKPCVVKRAGLNQSSEFYRRYKEDVEFVEWSKKFYQKARQWHGPKS